MASTTPSCALSREVTYNVAASAEGAWTLTSFRRDSRRRSALAPWKPVHSGNLRAAAAVALLLLLVGVSCFFYGRSKGSVAEPSGGNSRPEHSPQPLKELVPAEEAAVVSVAPEAEEPPPPPTKGWFWRAEPQPEPTAPEPEPAEAERPPLSPFSALRAERERELKTLASP